MKAERNILVKDNAFEEAKQENVEEANDLDFWELEDKGQESIPENEFNHALIIDLKK